MHLLRYGLRNDVKDFLLTFHEEPKSLTKAISRVIRCDNRLFERHSERQQFLRPRGDQTYASIIAGPPSNPIQVINDGPTPMEIDTTRHREPLSNVEKQRRWANRLCLYCGGPGHIAITCPHKPKRQVNHVSTQKLESCPIVRVNNSSAFNNHSDLCQSNNFEVLSQLNELLND
jgi:hypothetical protein